MIAPASVEAMAALARGPLQAAYGLLPPSMRSDRADVMLFAIGLQESRFLHRRQMNDGPARGYWQFERRGGVHGVLNHPASKLHARAVCVARGVTPSDSPVHLALERDDVLAAAFARLLLWTDPAPLPREDSPDEAWALYLRVWRPGKPHPETWPELHREAVDFVQGAL